MPTELRDRRARGGGRPSVEEWENACFPPAAPSSPSAGQEGRSEDPRAPADRRRWPRTRRTPAIPRTGGPRPDPRPTGRTVRARVPPACAGCALVHPAAAPAGPPPGSALAVPPVLSLVGAPAVGRAPPAGGDTSAVAGPSRSVRSAPPRAAGHSRPDSDRTSALARPQAPPPPPTLAQQQRHACNRNGPLHSGLGSPRPAAESPRRR